MAGSKRATWAKRVEQWKRSGLTAKQFAARAGLNAGTLSYWKWRLGKEAREGKPSGTALAKRGEPVSFVEVSPLPVATGRLEVGVGRYTVAVEHGFDTGALDQVLDVLEARQS